MVLTVRTALLAVVTTVLVALLVPTGSALLAALGVVLVIAALDAALAGSPRSVEAVRGGSSSCRLGDEVPVNLVLTNLGTRRVRGLVRDAWVPSAGAGATRSTVDVPAGEVQRIVTVLRPTRRGDRTAAAVTVRSIGPLGLAGRQVSLAAPWSVRVLPAFPSRAHLPSRLARLRELDGRSSVQVRGQGTEFDSLREYVVGDDVRSIDWRATARSADVVVRTWRPERDRRVVLVLDTGRTSAARLGDATRLDAAMDAAQLLAVLASRAGDRIDLLAYDRVVHADVRALSGTDVLPELAAAMTRLDPALVETDARGLVAAVLARVRQRALVVLLTSIDPAPMEAGLLPVLPQLTARHQVVLASVRDPEVAAMSRARGDAEQVYGAAAADRTLAARDAVRDRITRLGVEVVDEGPATLAPAVADLYLALKRAGRL